LANHNDWSKWFVFDWPIIMIRPGGLLLVVPTPPSPATPKPIWSPNFSFMGGGGGVAAKKVKN
jgi:hypothetical protein